MVVRWLAGIGLGLGISAGCSDAGYFVCTSNAECTEAEGGRCEPSGACSFPDVACPTGRRYGEAGNPNIAGQCVPPGDIGGGTESETGAASGDGTTSEGDATSSPASESDGTTTSSADATDSGGATDSADGTTSAQGTTSAETGSTESGGSSSSTGDPGPDPDMYQPCTQPDDCMSGTCAYFVEPGTLDPLGNFCSDIGCDDPVLDCLDIGTEATRTCVDVPVNGVLESICALDCSDTGAAGCAGDMVCLDNILGLPGMCAHTE